MQKITGMCLGNRMGFKDDGQINDKGQSMLPHGMYNWIQRVLTNLVQSIDNQNKILLIGFINARVCKTLLMIVAIGE